MATTSKKVKDPEKWMHAQFADILEEYSENSVQEDKCMKLLKKKDWLWNVMVDKMVYYGLIYILEDMRYKRRQRIKGSSSDSEGDENSKTPNPMPNRKTRMRVEMEAARDQYKWDLLRINNKPYKLATFEDVKEVYENDVAHMKGLQDRIDFEGAVMNRLNPGEVVKDVMEPEEFDRLVEKYYSK